jgi:uroporphyrinogen-III decarboxylase
MDERKLPVEFVFSPNWWFREYGLTFDECFYLDRRRRISDDLLMRRSLFERFGLASAEPECRPILGSLYVAGGFVIPALFGAQIKFSENLAPAPIPLELDRQAVMDLRVPDIRTTWPLRQLLEDAQELQRDFGFVLGDVNTDGVLNTALALRGQALFLDFSDDPDLVEHLFAVIADTIAQVAQAIRGVSGTSSISVNRSIVHVDPRIFLHANCSLQMISPDLYRRFLLPCDAYLSEQLEPYGIHHCGSNFELFGDCYRRLEAVFFDVGWGSDVQAARELFPDVFLNLRLSPVRMLNQPPEAIRQDVKGLLAGGHRPGLTGICAINLDYGTPDENVAAVLEETE